MLGLTLLTAMQLADPLAIVVDRLRPDHDMLSYHIGLEVPDRGTEIVGATTLRYAIRGGRGPLVLDFDSVFVIDSIVPVDGRVMRGRVRAGELRIDHWGRLGDTLEVTIHYHGSPRDGLYIQDNVHGDRTAFADNWPNRARHWFPSEDHPSDKAFASFAVEVPAGWKVVANGALRDVDTLVTGRTAWHWATERKVPVYTMVIGAGPLTVTEVRESPDVRQSLWTFAEDSAFAVEGPFRRVGKMVEILTRTIGPFPYAKLAHVESSTRFGGMENSSAIFYTERGYVSRRMGESLVAHETAHQWFGDAVTEHDWHHLWLSEGFASYFDPVYFEILGEVETFREAMRSKKASYLRSPVVDRPVIDTTVTALMSLLNANNYPKGAWILHMLRREVGDSVFFRGVRDYYRTYRDSTALSADFLAVMERQSGRSLRRFFEQWLLQPGYPQLDVAWEYGEGQREVLVYVSQVQPEAWGSFALRVPVRLRGGGTVVTGTAAFDGSARSTVVRFAGVSAAPTEVTVDTDDVLATVGRVSRRKGGGE